MMANACVGIFMIVLCGTLSWCEVGNDCPECTNFLCSTMTCAADELCVLKSFTCVSDPCPKLPQCLKASGICNGNRPLTDDNNEVVTCDSAPDSCPTFHTCMDSVCCPAVIPVVPNVQVPKESEKGFPLPDILHELNKIDHPDEKDCRPCGISLCGNANCPEYPDAHCMSENCSCIVWFEDDQGRHVECLRESDIPVFPHIPGFDFGKVENVTETMAFSSSVGKHGEVDEPNDAWKYGIIAACAVIVLGAIVFIVYKIVTSRRKSQDKSRNAGEEQKVPLKEVVTTNGDNNNKAKSNDMLLHSQGNETAASSISGVEA